MPPPNARKRSGRRLAKHGNGPCDDAVMDEGNEDSDTENILPAVLTTFTNTSKKPRETLKSRLAELDARIAIYQSSISRGALLNHKDGERGYQDKCSLFMREHKKSLYDMDESGKFPDVSNNRYGCYTYAAVEVICFHSLFEELILEIVDGKTKSGQQNHVEHNILKGLNCTATMTQLAALAIYGLLVSWPYMAFVRGTKEDPINLLSLTDIHRKLPAFCSYIADHPSIVLDPATPLNQLTLDGLPLRHHLLLPMLRQLRPELPDLLLLISAMFSGAAEGWIHFTPEFHVGGTFDSLTPEQRSILFIPYTDDCNEGMLGAYRVHMRHRPNSTPESFSNIARTKHNNTEAFIKKCCNDGVHKFVRREVRLVGASRRRVQFRKSWLALQHEKAANALARRAKTAARKQATVAHLASIQLEFDVAKIQGMNSMQLKEQLQVYRDTLQDPVLLKLLWTKDMRYVDDRRRLVLEAREREVAKRRIVTVEIAEVASCTSPMLIVDEYGYSPDDDAEWEDITT